MLAKLTSKNQLTLPKKIIEYFKDIHYFDVILGTNGIVLKPVKLAPAGKTLEIVREKAKRLGITPEDIHHAIAWARKRKI